MVKPLKEGKCKRDYKPFRNNENKECKPKIK